MSEQTAPRTGAPAAASRLTLREGVQAPSAARPARPSLVASRLTVDAVGFILAATIVWAQAEAPPSVPALMLATIASVLGFGSAALYSPAVRLPVASELGRVVAIAAMAAMAAAAAELLMRGPGSSDAMVALWLLAVTTVGGGRLVLQVAERAFMPSRPDVGGATLIVGSGHVGRRAAQRLLDEPQLGLRPIGFLDKDPLVTAQSLSGVPADRLPVLGSSYDLERIVTEGAIEHVLIAFSTAPSHVMLDLVRRCWRLGVTVMMVPRLYEVEGRRVQTGHLGALPIVTLASTDPQGWAFRAKYAIDRLLAALVLLVVTPLLALIAAGVALTMGRPVLFRQRRVGRDGHVFEMLKFRTMRGSPSADGENDAHWAWLSVVEGGHDTPRLVEPGASKAEDDRLTPFGAMLRKLSLDELPQLWNVVRGDMSLVGPRPERVHYVERFENAVYRYPDRHRVKSGLTGWAQIHGLRGETSLADRIEWDNFYIENWSPWLDVKIILMTLPSLVRDSRAR